jgi:hypothetical protein
MNIIYLSGIKLLFLACSFYVSSRFSVLYVCLSVLCMLCDVVWWCLLIGSMDRWMDLCDARGWSGLVVIELSLAELYLF